VSPRSRKAAKGLNFKEEGVVIRIAAEQPVRGSKLSPAARSRTSKPKAQGSGVQLVARSVIKAAPKDKPGNLTASQRRNLKRSSRRHILRKTAAEAKEVNHPVSATGTTAKADAIPPPPPAPKIEGSLPWMRGHLKAPASKGKGGGKRGKRDLKGKPKGA
jgi:hypothetical protein